MSVATLGSNACMRARIQIPSWSRAWADVELVEPEEIDGQQTLKIADASWVMTVVSGGPTEDGRARYRLVAGHGGWGKELPAKPYQNDAGVDAATLIRDAAAACGEVVGALPTRTFGPHYARLAGPASDILHLASPQAWYIDALGVTQFGGRPTAPYEGDGTRVRVDLAAGVVELATDEISNLAPGVTIDGHGPATDIEIDSDVQRLTVRAYINQARSEISDEVARLVRALFPWLRYAGTYEYRVVTQSGERLNLQPVRAATGLPDFARVPVRPGVPGVKAQVKPGELVLVCFADNDPSRPQVIAHDHAESPGWMPLQLQLGEEPALGVARVTDPVIAGPFGGSIVNASIRVKAGM